MTKRNIDSENKKQESDNMKIYNVPRYNQAEPPPKVHLLQHVRDADPTLPEEKKVCEESVLNSEIVSC